jgi:dihydropteroate synthase
MTENIVRNRLKEPLEADRVIVPGRSRMNLGHLADHYGVPFERGPDEIIDLPQFFGHDGKAPDLSKQDIRIFAEIVDAPTFSVEQLVARGRELIAKGGDVVDIGCQPDVDFPHLEETVAALKREGFKVSVDSGDTDELRRGARAGADFVLSLDESNLDAIDGTSCVPILLPRPHGDLQSLLRAIDLCKAKGIPHIADPVLAQAGEDQAQCVAAFRVALAHRVLQLRFDLRDQAHRVHLTASTSLRPSHWGIPRIFPPSTCQCRWKTV